MEDRITIDGREYVAADSRELASRGDGAPYVLVRTHSAGVFAGYLAERIGKEGRVVQARRIWYWDGAASLSELALRGPSKPDNCKFPAAVDYVDLTEIIEVLPVTKTGKAAIEAVPEWRQHAS